MSIHCLEEAAKRGLIASSQVASLAETEQRFPLQISELWTELCCRGSKAIQLQCLPDEREKAMRADDMDDPIGDTAHEPVPGAIHRYPDRLLLLPTLNCFAHCRFCFRKARTEAPFNQDAVIAYLSQHSEIKEVILSGGDSLTLSTERLSSLLDACRAVSHVRRLRIHTRAVSFAPERIDDALIACLKRVQPVYMALHINHPDELCAETRAAIEKLANAGIVLVSQTVLLRGVNDSPETLTQLCQELLDCRVRPYYLHHLDRAPGTQHFRVSVSDGLALYREACSRLQPLAQPRYVLDIPGGFGKTQLVSAIPGEAPHTWRVQSPLGGEFVYVDPAF